MKKRKFMKFKNLISPNCCFVDDLWTLLNLKILIFFFSLLIDTSNNFPLIQLILLIIILRQYQWGSINSSLMLKVIKLVSPSLSSSSFIYARFLLFYIENQQWKLGMSNSTRSILIQAYI